MLKFRTRFGQRTKPLAIGMLHVPPIPGASPFSDQKITGNASLTARPYSKFLNQHYKQLLAEAKILINSGFDGVILENMADLPYGNKPICLQTTICMNNLASLLIPQVKKMERKYPSVLEHVDMEKPAPLGKTPLFGVQILSGGWKEALTIGYYFGADFVRTEGYTFAHVGDEGFHNSIAREFCDHRAFLENSLYKNSNPTDPRVYNFTDIRKKHSSHAITADISLIDDGVAAQFFKTDACIITGKHTGESPSAEDVQEFKASLPDMPVVLGSGISAENVKNHF
jgi:predicted TIM-barrel enzyme